MTTKPKEQKRGGGFEQFLEFGDELLDNVLQHLSKETRQDIKTVKLEWLENNFGPRLLPTTSEVTASSSKATVSSSSGTTGSGAPPSKEKCRTLELEVKTLKKKIRKLEQSRTTTTPPPEKKVENVDLLREKEKVQKVKSELSTASAEYKMKIEQMKVETEKCKEQQAKALEQIKVEQKTRKEVENKINLLETKCKTERNDKDISIQQLEGEKRGLVRQLEVAQNDKNALSRRLEAILVNLSLIISNAKAKEKAKTIQSSDIAIVDKFDQTIQILREQIETFRKRLTTCTTQNKTLTAEITRINAELAKRSEEVTATKLQLTTCKIASVELQARLVETEQKRKEAEQSAERKRKEAEEEEARERKRKEAEELAEHKRKEAEELARREKEEKELKERRKSERKRRQEEKEKQEIREVKEIQKEWDELKSDFTGRYEYSNLNTIMKTLEKTIESSSFRKGKIQAVLSLPETQKEFEVTETYFYIMLNSAIPKLNLALTSGEIEQKDFQTQIVKFTTTWVPYHNSVWKVEWNEFGAFVKTYQGDYRVLQSNLQKLNYPHFGDLGIAIQVWNYTLNLENYLLFVLYKLRCPERDKLRQGVLFLSTATAALRSKKESKNRTYYDLFRIQPSNLEMLKLYDAVTADDVTSSLLQKSYDQCSVAATMTDWKPLPEHVPITKQLKKEEMAWLSLDPKDVVEVTKFVSEWMERINPVRVYAVLNTPNNKVPESCYKPELSFYPLSSPCKHIENLRKTGKISAGMLVEANKYVVRNPHIQVTVELYGPFFLVSAAYSPKSLYCAGNVEVDSSSKTPCPAIETVDSKTGERVRGNGINRMLHSMFSTPPQTPSVSFYGYSGSGKTFYVGGKDVGGGERIAGIMQAAVEDLLRGPQPQDLKEGIKDINNKWAAVTSIRLRSIDFIAGKAIPVETGGSPKNLVVQACVFRKKVLLPSGEPSPRYFASQDPILVTIPWIKETVQHLYDNSSSDILSTGGFLDNKPLRMPEITKSSNIREIFNKFLAEVEDFQVETDLIKITGNNPKSSRVHTYYKFEVTYNIDEDHEEEEKGKGTGTGATTKKKKKKTYFSIADFAGMENPVELQHAMWPESKDVKSTLRSILENSKNQFATKEIAANFAEKLLPQLNQLMASKDRVYALYVKKFLGKAGATRKILTKENLADALYKDQNKWSRYFNGIIAEGIFINEANKQFRYRLMKRQNRDLLPVVKAQNLENYNSNVKAMIIDPRTEESWQISPSKVSKKKETSSSSSFTKKTQTNIGFYSYLKPTKTQTPLFTVVSVVNVEKLDDQNVKGAKKTLDFAQSLVFSSLPTNKQQQ